MEKVFANMPNQSPMPMKATRILEINPNHPIFETLKSLYASDKDKVKEVAEVLYDQACLIEGFAIKDPIAYSKKICEIVSEINSRHKLSSLCFFFIHDTFNLDENYEVSRINERSRRCWKTKVK